MKKNNTPIKKVESLDIKNLKVSVDDKEILKDVSLIVKPGELHVIMGPNGSGKSTLAQTLMGHPNYQIKGLRSKVNINGENLLEMSPDERAQSGLFLAFQYPVSVAGVSVQKFLWSAYKSLHPETKKSVLDFRKEMKKEADLIGIDNSLLGRSLNDGFSGGEKKKIEILSMSLLKPKYVMLDEIDSGLDVDAIKMVASGVKRAITDVGVGVILITHYQRILKHIRADFVHVMKDGLIVKSGGEEVVGMIESEGYGKNK